MDTVPVNTEEDDSSDECYYPVDIVECKLEEDLSTDEEVENSEFKKNAHDDVELTNVEQTSEDYFGGANVSSASSLKSHDAQDMISNKNLIQTNVTDSESVNLTKSKKKKTYICHECEFITDIKSSMEKHLMTVHLGSNSFPCSQCEMTFAQKPDLDSHIKSAHKVRRFPCPYCEYRATFQPALKRHFISMHTNLKPYKCEECGTCFSRKSTLGKHVDAVHRRRKPYQCPLCEYKASNTDVKRHISAVHQGDKPHKCTVCYYSTSYVSALNRHINTVHRRAKPHQCPHCEYTCSEKRDLKRHIARKHTSQPNEALNLTVKLP